MKRLLVLLFSLAAFSLVPVIGSAAPLDNIPPDEGTEVIEAKSVLSFFRADSLSKLQTCTTEQDPISKGENYSSSCEGESANVHCSYWNVSYEVGLIWTSVECETGGDFKCEEGECPCDEDEVQEERQT